MSDNTAATSWHLDKRISISHIVTTLTVAVAIVIWLMRLESAVSLNSSGIVNNTIQIQRVEQAQSAQYSEILRRLERIDDRLNTHTSIDRQD